MKKKKKRENDRYLPSIYFLSVVAADVVAADADFGIIIEVSVAVRFPSFRIILRLLLSVMLLLLLLLLADNDIGCCFETVFGTSR